jgi:hypothetical protein
MPGRKTYGSEEEKGRRLDAHIVFIHSCVVQADCCVVKVFHALLDLELDRVPVFDERFELYVGEVDAVEGREAVVSSRVPPLV